MAEYNETGKNGNESYSGITKGEGCGKQACCEREGSVLWRRMCANGLYMFWKVNAASFFDLPDGALP